MSDSKLLSIDLRSRLALRIPEAAAVLGLSENCFRKVLPEIGTIRVGKAVLIPVKGLEDWLRRQAEVEQVTDDRVIGELLDGLR